MTGALTADLNGRNSAPRLSVVVPVYNGRMYLTRCLEGLTRSTFADFEVLVVDDCSTDRTPEIVARYRARYLRTPKRVGPAGARNLGARSAEGQILVFVDADVILPPDALGLIASEFDHDLELAGLFGSYDQAPAWGNFLSQYKNLVHHYIHQISSENAVTFWAGCGAIRREVFDEMGGFDTEKYPEPSIEDIDLGLRMVRRGHRIHLQKQLQVKHLKKWTVSSLLRADIFYRAVPWTKLILETRQLPRDLNLTYGAQTSAALVGLLVTGALLVPVSLLGLMKWISPLQLAVMLAVLVGLLLALNWRVYIFFARKRSWGFALGAVFAHWLYYLYSGLVFLYCSAVHSLKISLGSYRTAQRAQRLSR